MSFSAEVKQEINKEPNKKFRGKNADKREQIRDAFLERGSVNAPDKAYHLEIVEKTREDAERLQGVMREFDIDAKVVKRKESFVVYIKEGEQIVTMLGIIGASQALMKFENERIVKEMRSNVNRRVNCETANINKTVSAAVKQTQAISKVEQTIGISALPENLREIARVRLENPDMPLKDLGEKLKPPVGKSGVNHRLRKIVEIAERL